MSDATFRWIEYQVEYNLVGVLCCLGPLMFAMFWGCIYLGIGAYRRYMDAHLVTVRLGLNEMPVSRAAMENMAPALHLLQQGIETTRRKPLDELTTLTYAPRLTDNNSGVDPAQEEATAAIEQILGSIDSVHTNGASAHE